MKTSQMFILQKLFSYFQYICKSILFETWIALFFPALEQALENAYNEKMKLEDCTKKIFIIVFHLNFQTLKYF